MDFLYSAVENFLIHVGCCTHAFTHAFFHSFFVDLSERENERLRSFKTVDTCFFFQMSEQSVVTSDKSITDVFQSVADAYQTMKIWVIVLTGILLVLMISFVVVCLIYLPGFHNGTTVQQGEYNANSIVTTDVNGNFETEISKSAPSFATSVTAPTLVSTDAGVILPDANLALKTYKQLQTTITWSGAFDAIANVRYTRIGRIVTAYFEEVAGMCSNNILEGLIHPEYLPSVNTSLVILITNDNIYQPGLVLLFDTGVIQIKNTSLEPFAVGQGGMTSFTIAYEVAV